MGARRLGVLALGLLACWEPADAPRNPQLGPAGGYAPDDFDFASACGGWRYASADREAGKHDSFPDRSRAGCFVPIRYDNTAHIDAIGELPAGCGYPSPDTRQTLEARAAVYERVAAGGKGPTPLELACELPADLRKEVATFNARTLRSYAAELAAEHRTHPYAIASTFGYGFDEQNTSPLLKWKAGEECVELSHEQRKLLDVNNFRAARVADAWHSGVAPLVSFSGGAVHAQLVEALMLAHLAHCDGGVPYDRMLLDPCADHTHTNVRNTGALIHGVGATTGYIVTDDFMQARYLQEWTVFDVLSGSIDQRAMRDWGYSVGSWRQASRGINAGFWFTPYRFWAEPPDRGGRFTCAVDVPSQE